MAITTKTLQKLVDADQKASFVDTKKSESMRAIQEKARAEGEFLRKQKALLGQKP